MLNFRVHYDGVHGIFDSVVYAIDTDHDRFLLVSDNDWFRWVPCSDCQLLKEEDISKYMFRNWENDA